MERWVVYALISMVFAGVTAVVAKMGLDGISGELGLVVRTAFVCVFVLALGVWTVPRAEFSALTARNYGWLAVSALATTASWVFYYKALDKGTVSTVSLIDKGSVIVAILLAALFLGEKITPRVAAGSALIVAGLAIIARK